MKKKTFLIHLFLFYSGVNQMLPELKLEVPPKSEGDLEWFGEGLVVDRWRVTHDRWQVTHDMLQHNYQKIFLILEIKHFFLYYLKAKSERDLGWFGSV